jgi:hypothetical protein
LPFGLSISRVAIGHVISRASKRPSIASCPSAWKILLDLELVRRHNNETRAWTRFRSINTKG